MIVNDSREKPNDRIIHHICLAAADLGKQIFWKIWLREN